MTRTLITDPDCPQSVRDQINATPQQPSDLRQGGEPAMTEDTMQKAREIAGKLRDSIHGDCYVGQELECKLADDLLRALEAERAERERLEARVTGLEAALKPFEKCARELPDDRLISEAHPEWERCLRRFKMKVDALKVRDFRHVLDAALNGAPRQ